MEKPAEERVSGRKGDFRKQQQSLSTDKRVPIELGHLGRVGNPSGKGEGVNGGEEVETPG